jgi:hypothetical protein
VELNNPSRVMPRCQVSEDWVSRIRKCDIDVVSCTDFPLATSFFDEELIAMHHPANATTNNLISGL